MFTLFYRNTRLLILTIILICVWGLSSYFALPWLEDPELVSRNASVKTFIPGADAARIEALITDKIEDTFTEIEEIKDYSSTSSSGSSIIIIELKDGVQKSEVDGVWSRVQNQLDEVKPELPAGASEPELEKIKIKAYALITALTWQQDNRPNYAILNRQAEVLKDRIQGIAGTEEVELYSDRDEEIVVEIEPEAIAQQLEASLEGTTGGSILESTEELPVKVRLSAANRDRVNSITSLDLLSSQNNSANTVESIPLSSLGKITLKPELANITRYNGQRVNTVQGFLTPGVLPDRALSDFKQQLNNANWQLPNGYSYEFGGEAEQKNNALGGLASTVGVIAVLMVATLVLSLGSFRLAAVIGVVAIASFGLGLFAIWLFGYPFGFNPIIGTVGLIGVAINDSIVVLAAIQQHPVAKTGNKKAIREVVLRSTRHVVATTLTTAIGFVPLLLGGGEFWPPLAIAIAGGVIGATLLALCLIPAAYLIVVNNKRKISPTYSQSWKTFY